MDDEKLHLALHFARRGYQLFPQNQDKRPLIKAWPDKATNQEGQIRAWAAQFPEANWAVATGLGSGVIGLDVDVKNGEPGIESLERLEAITGPLRSVRVRTPSGGLHIHLRYPLEYKIRTCRLMDYPGIEVKADRACLTLPGSSYADGRTYSLLTDGELAEFPAALIKLLKTQTTQNGMQHRCETVRKGHRNQHLMRLAGAMRRQGAEEAVIAAALLEENKSRCVPQLPEQEVKAVARSAARYEPTAPRTKQADVAIEIGEEYELFHDAEIAYVRIRVADHYEVWPLRGKQFRNWLQRQFYLTTSTALGGQALEDALGELQGKALFEGQDIPVHVRIAGDDQRVYLDLANEHWEIVEVTGGGWHLNRDAPVRFRRPSGIQALPYPESGGNLEDLLDPFLNMRGPDRKLYIACLVAAFRPAGPYPVLNLQGEQGSAKSSAAWIFRQCVDPNLAPLRSGPRDERDMVIAAKHGWVVAYDNLSHLPVWLSDALCRLATGSGFGTRELYSDDGEVLFQAQRPVILNGIEDLATRGDLLDRSVLVSLPPIEEQKRLTERSFQEQFKQVHPRILGALLDVVSLAVRRLTEVRLAEIPRMADFATFVAAAEPALGWSPGTFLNIYRQNRHDANALALDANPLVPALLTLMTKGPWEGRATELLGALGEQVDEQTTRSSAWPKAPQALSGALKRLAPNLRALGIITEWSRKGPERTIRIDKKNCVSSSPTVTSGEVPVML